MSSDQRQTAWDSSWEVEFPAADRDHLLLALVVRDLVHGTSVDLELESSEATIEVDYLAGDESGGDVYNLLLTAHVTGPECPEALQALTEEVLGQFVAEAEEIVTQSELIASETLASVEFRVVPEDEERWDLVVPDWLAPDGAEVPFGFRSLLTTTGCLWPDDFDLDAHGRVVLVPFGDEVHLYGVPAPPEEDGTLPVIG
jgi:hypothetical protein